MKVYIILILFVLLWQCDNHDQIAPKGKLDIDQKLPDRILKQVLKTNRISSNHYSELVVDPAGNTYIACFQKKIDQQDYISILKLNELGEMEWILGTAFKGRATAITLSHRNTIIVAGFYADILEFGDFRINRQSDGPVFLVELDFSGICQGLWSSDNDGIFNIRCNQNGELLIAGVANKDMHFGNQRLNPDQRDAKFFLAYLQNINQCFWIKRFDGYLSKIKSFQNDFYLYGKFHDQFRFESDYFQTEGRIDEDGFLVKINEGGQYAWTKVFGERSTPWPGNRSDEMVCDIAFNEKEELVVLQLRNPVKKQNGNQLVLSLLNIQDGLLIDENRLKEIAHNSIFTINYIEDNYWITGKTPNKELSSISSGGPSFLIGLNKNLNTHTSIPIRHGSNMIFRSAQALKGRLYLSGHFQQFLRIGNDSLKNDGNHELFFYSLQTLN